MTDGVVSAWATRARRARREPWTPFDRQKLERMWLAGAPIEELEEEFPDRSAGSIYAKAQGLGLPPRKGGAGARLKQGRWKKRKLPKHGGTNRRFVGVDHINGPKVTLEPHDPRYRAGTTIFPTTVIPAAKLARVLKSGVHSRKIGKTVDKGALRGAPIFTLTLEERATCPRTCLEWATCYGNNMHMPQRIHDDGTLTKRIWAELAAIAAENERFLVRLHVLGDFYSVDYVEFWRLALNDFPGLYIFGFTARMPPDPIGTALVELVRDFYDRCRLRFSGLREEEDGSVVVDRKEDAVGVLCPAQADPDRYCGSCALCWHSNVTISFLRH